MSAAPDSSEPSLEVLQFMHAEVRDQLDHQFSQIESLNGRAAQLLGFAGGILALTVGLQPPGDHWTASALFAAATVPFIVLVVLCQRAWSIEGWRRDPHPKTLWTRYRLWPEGYLTAQVVANMAESFDRNTKVVDRKVSRIKRAQIALAVELVCLVAAVIALPYVQ